MSKVFFTADTHFGDDAIRRYENRPFTDIEEMDRELIARWNAVVGPADTVWHLGDFGGPGREAALLQGDIFVEAPKANATLDYTAVIDEIMEVI